jgi:hypothetical protein
MFTEQTVIDSWLDRWFGSLMSAGIHLVLVLGSTFVLVGELVCAQDGGSGFACSVRQYRDRMESFERAPDLFRTGDSIEDPDSSPVALLAEELASAFGRGERSSGCVACAVERRTGRVVVPRGIGPQGLCCRHVIMMETGR